MRIFLLVSLLTPVWADYYSTLGIKKDATTKEIRSAFKKLALLNHPDKNKDDPEAENNFMKINEAYEVLKEETTRRTYDLYGEEGLKENKERKQSRERHSYQYYREDFDLYGEDQEIVTLSSGDFKRLVERRGEGIWFINYYSPRCSHCHELVPVWRQLAKELEGVVRVGAVNCADSRDLCFNLRGYPSLILYTSSGQSKYEGRRDLDSLLKFVMSTVPPAPVVVLTDGSLKKALTGADRPWVLSVCNSEDDCVSRSTLDRVALSLRHLAYVGLLRCEDNVKVCEKLGRSEVFFVDRAPSTDSLSSILDRATALSSLVTQEITLSALRLLPQPTALSTEQLDEMIDQTGLGEMEPQVVIFGTGQVPLEFIRLIGHLKDTQLYQYDCVTSPRECVDLHITRHPTLLVLKEAGTERYHGRVDGSDMAIFIAASIASPLVELTPAHFPAVTRLPTASVVDFYAPWCPPCMELLPELREAAKEQPLLTFGTVDCSVHSALCTQLQIRSYPTLVVYNDSIPHRSSGAKGKREILTFVEDILRPVVLTVTSHAQWVERVRGRREDEVWFVDFYAPWCNPCRQLEPNWNSLARSLAEWPGRVTVAKVDCTTQEKICNEENIRGYPTIRAYKPDKTSIQYQGWGQLNDLKAWTLPLMPSNVVALTPRTFVDRVLTGSQPWLVSFYTPGCGPCQKFATEMEALAGMVEGDSLSLGKVDCNTHYNLCYQAKLTGFPSLLYYQGTTNGQKQEIRGRELETGMASSILAQLGLTKHHVRDEL